MDIPKIIHYVWLGSGKMSPFIQDCVDSWKRVMPDYEIKCWNEQNFDVNSVVWVKEALDLSSTYKCNFLGADNKQ